jgi:hypothetical protein
MQSKSAKNMILELQLLIQLKLLQSKFVSEMWIKFFENIKNSPIKKVIGCLPFYPTYDLPNYDLLTKLEGFEQVELLFNQKFIEYSRARTFVGHMVFKVSINKSLTM